MGPPKANFPTKIVNKNMQNSGPRVILSKKLDPGRLQKSELPLDFQPCAPRFVKLLSNKYLCLLFFK
jgi:hypothetical protein